MKHIFNTLALLTLLTALFSCNKQDVGENPEPAPEQAALTLTIHGTEATSVTFSVTAADENLTWIGQIVGKEYFEMYKTDDELFNEDLKYYAYMANDAGVGIEEYLAGILIKGSHENLRYKGLDPETDYVIYVYGMSSEGNRTTPVFSKQLRTAEPYEGNITFEFEVSDEDADISVKIKPSHDGVAYYWNIITKDDLMEYGSDIAEAAVAFVEADILDLLEYEDISSRSEYYEWYSDMNETTSLIEGSAYTDYIIFAYKWDEDCNKVGDVAYTEYRTGGVSPSDNQITVELGEPTQSTIYLDIQTTNEDPYVLMAEPTSTFAGMSDDQIFESILARYGTYFIWNYIYNGSMAGTLRQMEPDTDYTLLIFGYKNGVMTTSMQKHEFRTLVAGNPEDCTFEFELIQAKPNSAYVRITPSDPSHWYYWLIYQADVTADYVKAQIKTTIDEWYYGNFDEFAYYELVQGQSEGEVIYLSPNTAYKVAAVIMDDETGEYLADVHFSEPFTTPEAVTADIEVEAGFDRFYDGDQIAEALPDYEIFKGHALVPVSIDIKGSYAEFYYTIFAYEEGLENPELFPDSMLHNSLMEYGINYQESTDFRAAWDTDLMIAAVALDYEGNFSTVYREKFRLSKSEASPADEFINSHKNAPKKVSSHIKETMGHRMQRNVIAGKKHSAIQSTKDIRDYLSRPAHDRQSGGLR